MSSISMPKSGSATPSMSCLGCEVRPSLQPLIARPASTRRANVARLDRVGVGEGEVRPGLCDGLDRRAIDLRAPQSVGELNDGGAVLVIHSSASPSTDDHAHTLRRNRLNGSYCVHGRTHASPCQACYLRRPTHHETATHSYTFSVADLHLKGCSTQWSWPMRRSGLSSDDDAVSRHVTVVTIAVVISRGQPWHPLRRSKFSLHERESDERSPLGCCCSVLHHRTA